MSDDKYVYIVEHEDGSIRANYSTGTRVYTRKSNAEKQASPRYGTKVVTYKLVKVEEGNE